MKVVTGLSLVLLLSASVVVMPSDVVDVGEEAEEVLMGLDDVKQHAKRHHLPLHEVDAKAQLGDSDAAQDDSKNMPLDLASISNAVKPREIQPYVDPKAEEASNKAIEALMQSLKDAQNNAVEAQVKAEKKEGEADEMKRLATVKEEKEANKVLKREANLRKTAVELRKKADALTKTAYETKMKMKESVKAMLMKEEGKYQKAHFAATEAEVARAEALTKAKLAKMVKPEPSNPCDKTFEKAQGLCTNQTKAYQALKGTPDEMTDSAIKSREEGCVEEATAAQGKCNKARVSEMSTENAAQATMSELNSAATARHHAMKLAASLASYKDVKKPKKPDGPVGLFQHKGLVYFANKDGTRTWVRYPTYKCHRATASVVPQQFPVSAELPELDVAKSETYCQMGAYKGIGNPDFYENCQCSGSKNKKNHGMFCDKWGYKFNWCYVATDCAYGNTAYSDEIPDTKVLVGCKIHPPLLDP